MRKKLNTTSKVQQEREMRLDQFHQIPVASNIVCLEGCDFTGKTSLARYLHEQMQEKHWEIIQSPGQTPIGKELRVLLKKYTLPNPVQRLLFNASDAMFFAEGYKDTGNYIFDRYWLSRIVYQCVLPNKFFEIDENGKGSQPSIRTVYEMIKEMTDYGVIMPKHTFVLFPVDMKIIQDRIEKSGRGELDHFEKLGLDRINNAYMSMIQYMNTEKVVPTAPSFFRDMQVHSMPIKEDTTIEELGDKIIGLVSMR